jgi:hypothetical protein
MMVIGFVGTMLIGRISSHSSISVPDRQTTAM